MKKIIVFTLLAIANYSHAQVPKTSLYNLVVKLLPDATQAIADVPWEKVAAINPVLKWSKRTTDNFTKKQTQSAATVIEINGNTIDCGGKSVCTWAIEAFGNSKSATQFVISSGLSNDLMGGDEENDITSVQYLFKGNKFTADPVMKCDDGIGYYEVKIPGKKTCWIHCYTEGGANGVSLWVEVFLNKNDMLKNCI